MNGDGFGVGACRVVVSLAVLPDNRTGWYDSVFDEELGAQPLHIHVCHTSESMQSCVVAVSEAI